DRALASECRPRHWRYRRVPRTACMGGRSGDVGARPRGAGRYEKGRRRRRPRRATAEPDRLLAQNTCNDARLHGGLVAGRAQAGPAVLRNLVDQKHDVLSVDRVSPGEPVAASLLADLTHFGQTVECLAGADAVVHLAAIPAPGIRTEEATFRTNMLSTYNVFEAARLLGLRRVVWASSETILGLPFEREQPAYAPIDEEHPAYPESSYALSKLLSE